MKHSFKKFISNGILITKKDPLSKKIWQWDLYNNHTLESFFIRDCQMEKIFFCLTVSTYSIFEKSPYIYSRTILPSVLNSSNTTIGAVITFPVFLDFTDQFHHDCTIIELSFT